MRCWIGPDYVEVDTENRFHTRGTYALMRLEHVAVVVACSALVLLNVNALDWPRFFAAFLVIDIVGYLPGAIAFRRHRGAAISRVYHYLYNIAHSYLSWTAIVIVWAILADGFEWAMLAIPIHLSGDRGFFGNVFKPVSLPFEPERMAQGESLTHHTHEPRSARGIR